MARGDTLTQGSAPYKSLCVLPIVMIVRNEKLASSPHQPALRRPPPLRRIHTYFEKESIYAANVPTRLTVLTNNCFKMQCNEHELVQMAHDFICDISLPPLWCTCFRCADESPADGRNASGQEGAKSTHGSRSLSFFFTKSPTKRSR